MNKIEKAISQLKKLYERIKEYCKLHISSDTLLPIVGGIVMVVLLGSGVYSYINNNARNNNVEPLDTVTSTVEVIVKSAEDKSGDGTNHMKYQITVTYLDNDYDLYGYRLYYNYADKVGQKVLAEITFKIYKNYINYDITNLLE